MITVAIEPTDDEPTDDEPTAQKAGRRWIFCISATTSQPAGLIVS
jgi:hypothetical protein